MRSGSTSDNSLAEVAISSVITSSGRFHSPATRARATLTASPGGAKRLNCGSVMLLTEGMIIPIRARAAGSGLSTGRRSVAASMQFLQVCLCLLNPQPGALRQRCPERIFLGDEALYTGDVEVLRQQRKRPEVLLNLRRFDDAPG